MKFITAKQSKYYHLRYADILEDVREAREDVTTYPASEALDAAEIEEHEDFAGTWFVNVWVANKPKRKKSHAPSVNRAPMSDTVSTLAPSGESLSGKSTALMPADFWCTSTSSTGTSPAASTKRSKPRANGKGADAMQGNPPKIVKSRDTGKTYLVVREYKNLLLVDPTWKKHGQQFTIDRSAVE